MNRIISGSWAIKFAVFFLSTQAFAQNEQFIPVLGYRTGAYAVSGLPYVTGEVDYYRLINERDGGINGRAASKDGSVFKWNFPLLSTYWSAADIVVQHIAKEIGGADKLSGKKIALLFHDSPFGKEPIPALLALAHKYQFQFRSIPVPHPGIEQEPQWRSIRQDLPDYVLLWGWGVM